MRLAGGRSLEPYELGGGSVRIKPPTGARLQIPPRPEGYANAQLDDYRPLSRQRFPWRPPARLSLRAQCSLDRPLGTLGFGFWNDPFSLSLGAGGADRRLPTPPCAVWFFYGSPPNDFAFSREAPGYGFRAMALRSPRIPSPLFSVAAATGWALSRLPFLRGPLINLALSGVRSVEHSLAQVSLGSQHEYEILWDGEAVEFAVDSTPIVRETLSMQGPLGFVTWIDNQYAIATPDAGLRFGTVPTAEDQWLEVSDLRIESI